MEVTEEEIMIKSILLPQAISALRELGNQRIRLGQNDLRMADMIENASIKDALIMLKKLYIFEEMRRRGI